MRLFVFGNVGVEWVADVTNGSEVLIENISKWMNA